jgi:hypothetical protein
VIVDPPFEVGAVHVRLTWAFPAEAITEVGAPATVLSATGKDPVEA